jgi:acetate---CoA ligase (ADP-forming)
VTPDAPLERGFAGFAEAGSVAVVGASERNIMARIVLENLRRWRFSGKVWGLHPSGAEVDGVPTHPSWDATGPADVCLLAIGAQRLPEAVRTASEAGVRRFVIPGAGANEGGRAVEGDLRAAIRETGVEAIGPNCMGYASIHEGVVPYVGSIDEDLQPGGVGLVSHSGSALEMFTALPWRVGFSHIVSVGNELGLDMADALEFLVHDDRTRVIGLFVEGVRRPDEFRSALRGAAEAGKPVAVLKVGASEIARAGAVTHTGALAGDADVFSAVLRDTGAIEVRDLEELLAAAELLGKGVARPTGKVVYVGDSGGEANLFADLAASAGVALPPLGESTRAALTQRFPSLDPVQNPLDLWAIGVPEETYRDGVGMVVEREPHLVVLALDKFLARDEPERVFVRSGVEAVDAPGAVVLMAFAGSESGDLEILRTCWERRIPVVRGAGPLLSALAAVDRWERWRQEPLAAETPSVDEQAVRGVEPEAGAWSEGDAKRLLAAAGIPVPAEREAATAEEAAALAVEIGFPVVAKASGPGLEHKTEMGGVRLGLGTAPEVEEAAVDLLDLAPRVLVAEQRRAELELIVSAFRDEQFGPCGLVGMGGIWTEALRETAVVAGPGSPPTVRRALERRAWGRLLLEGARGRRFPVDRVIDVVLRLIAILDGRPDLATVEINPLFVEEDGAIAVDALVEPQPPSRNRSSAS